MIALPIQHRVATVLAEVSFPGYHFEIGTGDRLAIRAIFSDRCSVSGKESVQHTRDWLLTDNPTKNEIVQTALKCVLTSVEHEARERFRYRGKAIFGPHFDMDSLYRICVEGALDYYTGKVR